MNSDTFLAFGDELVKIAFFQKLRKGFTQALRDGWHGTQKQIDSGQGATWFGKGRIIKPGMGANARRMEEALSLGGLTRALPVGSKSLMALGTGLMAREALRPQDPSGQQRSRAERVSGLAGNTLGGLAGAGFASRLVPGSGFIAPIIGGMVGAHTGEKVMTAPFKHQQPQPAQMQQPQPMPYQGVR